MADQPVAAAAGTQSDTGDRTRRWPPPMSAVFGAVFVLWGAYIGAQPFHDNSFITHLATGRLILDGSFPRADVYSFTAEGADWVVQSWLASAAYAGLERLGGSSTIHLLIVALSAALAAMVWILTAGARTLIPRILVAGLAMSVAAPGWSERPLMFGLAGIGVVLLTLEGRLPAWVLVPTFWVWGNAHGSFPLGVVLVLSVLAGTALDGADTSRERRVLAFSVVGCLTVVLGPLGLDALLFPVEMLGKSDLLQQIVEWQSPDFSGLWAQVYLLQVLVALFALTRRATFRHGIPLLVFLAASLVAARNVTVASLVMVPGMAHGLADLGTLTGHRRSPVTGVAAGLLSAVVALVTWVSVQSPGWDFDFYPMAALAHGREQGILDGETRLLAPDFVGNLLEGVDGEGAAVFMDDRYDMYPAELIEDYAVLARARPGWDDLLDDHGIDVVLWQHDEPLGSVLLEDPGWRIVFADGKWLMAERRPAT